MIDAIREKRHAVSIGVLGVGTAALLLANLSARPAVYTAQGLQGLASSLIAPGRRHQPCRGRTCGVQRTDRPQRPFRLDRQRANRRGDGLRRLFVRAGLDFWFAALQAIPALLCIFLLARRRGRPRPPESGPTEGPREDDSRLTWKGVKSLVSDRRLLVFAACILLFFVASAALGPGIAGRVTRQYPEHATLIVAAMTLLSQAIVAVISPWIGRAAQRSGRRPMLLIGWGLVPAQAALYAAVLYGALPFAYALAVGQILNGFSSAVFGVMMTVVTADLTAGTGRFNLTLGALGAAIAAGASLSYFFSGIVVSALGVGAADLALAVVGVLGVLLLWLGLPETRPLPATPQNGSEFAGLA